MRIDRQGDKAFFRWAAGLAVLAGAGLGAAAAGRVGLLVGTLVGLLAAWTTDSLLRRRTTSRQRLLSDPFPSTWRHYLEDAYDHYERLPDDLRRRFEDDVRIFVAEKRITGVEVEVSDDLRILVAASAVTLSLGWPDYEWHHLGEVLLYPDDFDRDYRFGGADRAGETHPWGTVILSVPALCDSFEDPDDGFHVGIHEFAHLLDVDQTHFDGIPVGLAASRALEWVALAKREMERMEQGRSVIDPYGAEDPVEFLAVAVEAFFERPQELRRRHAEVYAILRDYFGQDPAAWDDRRGLAL